MSQVQTLVRYPILAYSQKWPDFPSLWLGILGVYLICIESRRENLTHGWKLCNKYFMRLGGFSRLFSILLERLADLVLSLSVVYLSIYWRRPLAGMDVLTAADQFPTVWSWLAVQLWEHPVWHHDDCVHGKTPLPSGEAGCSYLQNWVPL